MLYAFLISPRVMHAAAIGIWPLLLSWWPPRVGTAAAAAAEDFPPWHIQLTRKSIAAASVGAFAPSATSDKLHLGISIIPLILRTMLVPTATSRPEPS